MTKKNDQGFSDLIDEASVTFEFTDGGKNVIPPLRFGDVVSLGKDMLPVVIVIPDAGAEFFEGLDINPDFSMNRIKKHGGNWSVIEEVLAYYEDLPEETKAELEYYKVSASIDGSTYCGRGGPFTREQCKYIKNRQYNELYPGTKEYFRQIFPGLIEGTNEQKDFDNIYSVFADRADLDELIGVFNNLEEAEKALKDFEASNEFPKEIRKGYYRNDKYPLVCTYLMKGLNIHQYKQYYKGQGELMNDWYPREKMFQKGQKAQWPPVK